MSQSFAKRPDSYVDTVIDDEVVVMRCDDGNLFSLKGTARDIWLALDETPDRDALIERLAAEFDVPADMIAGEVDDFLAAMASAGIIAA